MGGSPYLEETKASIVSQLTKDAELLIVKSDVKGFDLAYLDAVEKSTAEYVWLFSDDDIILPGAIDCALRYINARSPDLLLAESEVFDKTLTHKLKSNFVGHSSTFYEGLHDLALQRFAPLMTYVGSVIIKRDVWLKAAENYKDKYVGSRYITFGLPAEVAMNKVQYIGATLSRCRFGHQSWIKNSRQLDREFRNLVWGLDSIDYAAKVKIAPPIPLWLSIVFLAQENPLLAKFLKFVLQILQKQHSITYHSLP